MTDRSTPEATIRSLYDAVNRREYARAYSYWEPMSADLPSFDDFQQGYADTVSVDVTMGDVGGGVGAGQLFFSVPVTLLATRSDASTQTFVGCYILHLARPQIQAVPPFHPMGIQRASVFEVADDADTATLMQQACRPLSARQVGLGRATARRVHGQAGRDAGWMSARKNTGTTPTAENIIEQEPAHIERRAESVGSRRLDRSNLEILLTAVIGGGEVSIGALAAMTVLGSVLDSSSGIGLYQALTLAGLVFPIGFIFVIMGRSELFTENFLIPVIAVFNTERTLGSLALLWGLSWTGNMLGCAGTAVLLLAPEAVGQPILHGFAAYTDYKLGMQPIAIFISAVLAGGVMSTLTWSLLSVQHTVGRILVIAAGAYVLMAANLSHSIVSASVLMVGYRLTQHSLADLALWLVIATAGNIVGGVGLVTLFRVAQVRQQR